MRIKGRIKRFFEDKGYGFISFSERQGDIFFHITNFLDDSDKNIVEEGLEVEFRIGPGRGGGEKAEDIRILKTPAENHFWSKEPDKKRSLSKTPTKKHFLPKDTLAILKSKSIDNFSLKLNKFAYFFPDEKGGGFAFFKKARRKGQKDYWISPYFSKVDLKALNLRHKDTIAALNFETKQLQFIPDWRLTVGLGQASVYETSISLHHIYGIPYIPASSIKGVLRNWIITTLFDGVEGNETVGALADQGFCRIFGSPVGSIRGEYHGDVHFFDAFPMTEPKVIPDIMNPHFGPYYADDSDEHPPADYYSPVPVFFLAVEGTTFTIICGVPKEKNAPIESGVFANKRPLDVALSKLRECLAEHGVGAKTAIGYGTSTRLT
jgi:CRISPR-associated protein Cmr6